MDSSDFELKKDLPQGLLIGDIKNTVKKNGKLAFEVELDLESIFKDPPQPHFLQVFLTSQDTDYYKYLEEEEDDKMKPSDLAAGDCVLVYFDGKATAFLDSEELDAAKFIKA